MRKQRNNVLILAVLAAVVLCCWHCYQLRLKPSPVSGGWIPIAVHGSDEDRLVAINEYTGQERVLWKGVRADQYGIVCSGRYVYFGGFENELDRLTALWRCDMVSGEVQHISDCVYSWCIDSERLYYSYKEDAGSNAVIRVCRLNGDIVEEFIVDDTVTGDRYLDTLIFKGEICGVSGRKMVYTKSALGTDALPYIFVMDLETREETFLEQGIFLTMTEGGFAAKNSLEWGMRVYELENLSFQTYMMKDREEMRYFDGKWFARVIESQERWYMTDEPGSLGTVLFECEYTPGGAGTRLYPGKEHAVVVDEATGCCKLVSYNSSR